MGNVASPEVFRGQVNPVPDILPGIIRQIFQFPQPGDEPERPVNALPVLRTDKILPTDNGKGLHVEFLIDGKTAFVPGIIPAVVSRFEDCPGEGVVPAVMLPDESAAHAGEQFKIRQKRSVADLVPFHTVRGVPLEHQSVIDADAEILRRMDRFRFVDVDHGNGSRKDFAFPGYFYVKKIRSVARSGKGECSAFPLPRLELEIKIRREQNFLCELLAGQRRDLSLKRSGSAVGGLDGK